MRNRINTIRTERHMSQKELALKTGVTRQTINYLERNRNSPSLDLAYRIAKVFNLTIEDVFQYEDYGQTSA